MLDAASPDAPSPNILRQWADAPNPAARRKAAAASNAPADLLEELAHDLYPQVRSAVAQNANTPLPVIIRLAEDHPEAVLANPARDMWNALQPGFLDRLPTGAATALFRQGTVPLDWLQWATRQPRLELAEARRLSAQHTSSPAILKRLVADCDAYTRLFVSRRAIRPRTTVDLLRKAGSLETLTNDGDSSQPLSSQEQERLFEAGPWGRWLLARHPGTDVHWLRRLASAFPDEVCIRMVPMRFRLMATQSGFRPQHDVLKRVVARHEATPPALRQRLEET